MEQIATPKKKWGQHFLGSEETAIDIANQVPSGKNVLEIGPGRGMLTQFLAGKCNSLTAVEIDETLVKILKKKFGKKILVKHGDCLEEDFSQYDVVTGLLPYNLSSLIIEKFIKSKTPLAVFVVQKEMGERIVAVPHSRDRSRLSVLCQNNAQCKLLEIYPAHIFWPKPKVQSTLVKLERKAPLPMNNEIVNAIFQHKNQKLRKALKHSSHLLGEKVDKIIGEHRGLMDKRAVELTLAELSALSN